MKTRETLQQSRLFIIFLNGHLSETSVIDSKYIKMTGWKIFTNLVPSQTLLRSSHRRCSVKKDVFKSLRKFTGKHLYWSHFLIKLQALGPATLLNSDYNRCFSVKFAKYLRTSILKNFCKRLLLLFLGFTKLNHNVFLWLSWRHRFLYNNMEL